MIKRRSREIVAVVVCLLMISSMSFPAAALVGPSERDPVMSSITEQTEGQSPRIQHAMAIGLLGATGDTSNQIRIPNKKGSRVGTARSTPISPSVVESIQTDVQNPNYAEQVDREFFIEHSKSTRLLRSYADRSPKLDSRINTSTALLLRGDRRLVESSITEAEQTLRRNQEHLSPDEGAAIRDQLSEARALLEKSEGKASAETTRGMLTDRSQKFQTVAEAWNMAVQAEDSVYQLSRVSIQIESRGDPVRNGSSTITRNITGVVEGANPDNIESVEVIVNEKRRIEANVTQANSSRFSASVTLSDRINTIRAQVTTVSQESGSKGGSSVDAGGSGLTRDIPVGAEADKSRTYLAPGSSSATFEFGKSLPIRQVTLNSTVSPEQSISQVRVYQFASQSSGLPIPEGELVGGFDVAVRQESSVASAPARFEIRLNKTQVSNSDSKRLQFLQLNRSSDRWERTPTTVRSASDFISVRSSVQNISSVYAITVVDEKSTAEPQQRTSTRTPTSPPTGSSDDGLASDTTGTATAEPKGNTPGESTQDSDGFFSSIIDGIQDFFSGLDNLLASSPPTQGQAAYSSSVVVLPDASASSGTVEQSEPPSVTRDDVLLLDGDGVTDTFELTELGTSPVNPDDDIASTSANESSNGIVDGAEDPDNDTSVSTAEELIGSDPLINDTDADGLSDGVESRLSAFNATVADSNDDGVIDGLGDLDEDGLTNAEEINRGTNPLSGDTDSDGLSDGEEVAPPRNVSATNPISSDTDADGLSDSEELRLGPDPTDPDTDDDGIEDGNETFTTSARSDTVGAEVSITGRGNVAESISISEGGTPQLNNTNVRQAQASPIVELESDRQFDSANVSISYDPSQVENESKLGLYRLNETTGTFRPLNSTINTSSNTVTAETEQFSRFAVFNVTNWESNFAAITPPQLGGDSGSVTPVDVVFMIDNSNSMSGQNGNDPTGLRVDATKRFVGGLIKGDRAAVVDFGRDANLVQPLTADFDTVNQSLDTRTTFGTEVGGAIRLARTEFSRRSNESRAKLGIFLTDGRPFIDSANPRRQARLAANENITIETIGFGNPNRNLLRDIASTTGGNFTEVDSAADLPQVFSRIANETTSRDSDGDGLTDATELGGYVLQSPSAPTVRTDPFDPDTDNDGIPDGVEAGKKTTETIMVSNDATSGVSSLNQTYERVVFNATSNPVKLDSDGDGLPDAAEAGSYTIRYTSNQAQTRAVKRESRVEATQDIKLSDIRGSFSTRSVSPNALDSDTDDDGITDGAELRNGTDPTSNDTDRDGITDTAEQQIAQADPALFDSRAPKITIKSISHESVPNEENNIDPLGDVKYTVRYEVRDPAGVTNVTIKRGDDRNETLYTAQDGDTTNVTKTVSVVAESFLGRIGGFVLGEKIQIAAIDTNGNGGQFITKTGPHVYKKGVILAGKIFPRAISPVGDLAIISGFAYGLFGAITGLAELAGIGLELQSPITLITALLTGNSRVLDLIRSLTQFAQAFFDRPIAVTGAFFAAFRTTQRTENPFNRPASVDNILDGVTDQAGKLIDGFQFSDAPSNYVRYGFGWYIGFVLSLFADTIIAAAAGLFTGGSGTVAVAAGVVAKLAGSTAVSTALQAGTVADLAGQAGRVATQIELFDPQEILNGTRSLTRIRSILVVGLASEEIPRAVKLALRTLEGQVAASLGLFRGLGSDRFLGPYLATTGREGLDALQAMQERSSEAAAVLQSPETKPATDRLVASGLASGSIAEGKVQSAYDQIGSTEDDEDRRQQLLIVNRAGEEGVQLVASQPASKLTSTVDLIESKPGADATELARLTIQAGGKDTSAALSKLGRKTFVKILLIDSGASAGAQENLVDAVAAGKIDGATVDRLTTRLSAASPQSRRRAVNRIAFATNATETNQSVKNFLS